MKKFLALILAITMIATLIPTAFADGGEEKITIKCDIQSVTMENGMYGSPANCTVPLSTLSYETTGGAYKYIRSSLTDPNQSLDTISNDKIVANKIVYRGAAANSAYGDPFNGYITLFNRQWISFEVNVPQDGMYSIKLNHKMGTSNASALNVYITDAETFYGKSTPFNLSQLGTYDAQFATSGGTKSDPASVNTPDWNNDRVVVTDKNLTSGKYIITFEAYVSDSASNKRAVIGDFTLEGTPIAEPETKKDVIYNVAQIMKNNGVYYTGSTQNGAAEAEKMTYTMTNGLFEVMDARGTITIGGAAATLHNFLKMAANATVDFKVNIPEDGTYFLKVNHQVSNDGGAVSVYVDGEYVGSYNCKSAETGVPKSFASGATSVWKNDVLVTADGIKLSAGEHVISYSARDGYGMISYFEFTNENLATDNVSLVFVDKTTLGIGEVATISGTVVSSLDGTVKAESNANTVYTSSDDKVVTVDGTTITAVGKGTADITATIGDVVAKRTITVLEAKVEGEVSLGVYSDVADAVTVTVDGEVRTEKVLSLPVGARVTVTARTDYSDYVFRGWKRGSRDNGVWISESEVFSFPIMTNTYLTAVYEPVAKEEDTVNVEFYNYNGQYLSTAENVGEKTFSDITKPEATLTGYTEQFWTVDGENKIDDNTTFKKLTRVVAKYRKKDSFVITIGNGITGATNNTTYPYDTELILSAGGKEGTWYVNEKPVAYGTVYSHCVWEDAAITFEEGGSATPIIAINKEPKANGARMISYDANGANIAEVGILFGENAKITSFESKAVSKKRGNSQGHFTAMPNGTERSTAARGYLIYLDGDTYRVIYAD